MTVSFQKIPMSEGKIVYFYFLYKNFEKQI